jgi:hypothetical protein
MNKHLTRAGKWVYLNWLSIPLFMHVFMLYMIKLQPSLNTQVPKVVGIGGGVGAKVLVSIAGLIVGLSYFRIVDSVFKEKAFWTSVISASIFLFLAFNTPYKSFSILLILYAAVCFFLPREKEDNEYGKYEPEVFAKWLSVFPLFLIFLVFRLM